MAHNNTCTLKKRGWTGLAIEPQAEFQQVWKEKGKTLLLPYAVGSEDGLDIDFWESVQSEFSGVADSDRERTKGHIVTVRQRTIIDILPKTWHDAC